MKQRLIEILNRLSFFILALIAAAILYFIKQNL